MKKIELQDIGQIMQEIYDSEINLKIGWLWDGGVDFLEGTEGFDLWADLHAGLMRGTGETDMCKAFETICVQLCISYPDSTFTQWFKNKFQYEV